MLGGMPEAFPFSGFQRHGCRTKIVCHMCLRAGREQDGECDAGTKIEGFHIHLGVADTVRKITNQH